MTKKKKRILVAAGVLVFFIALNANFFIANSTYFFGARKTVFIPPGSDYVPAAVKLPTNTLKIESLGIEAPIVYINDKKESAYQEALKKGVVHFPETAEPGQPGNCFIFGHSSDYWWSGGKYKTVFAVLPNIEKGTEILASNPSGQTFTYLVTESFVVGPDDTWVLDQKKNAKKILTLQTSYPIGTALKRYIVVAEMK